MQMYQNIIHNLVSLSVTYDLLHFINDAPLSRNQVQNYTTGLSRPASQLVCSKKQFEYSFGNSFFS